MTEWSVLLSLTSSSYLLRAFLLPLPPIPAGPYPSFPLSSPPLLCSSATLVRISSLVPPSMLERTSTASSRSINRNRLYAPRLGFLKSSITLYYDSRATFPSQCMHLAASIPAPQLLTFPRGVEALRRACRSLSGRVYARSCIRTSENTPSPTFGE